MAMQLSFTSKTVKATIYVLVLAIALGLANSARILDEVDPQPPTLVTPPLATNPLPPIVSGGGGPTTTLPSGQTPATIPTSPTTTTIDDEADSPVSDEPDDATSPVSDVPPVVAPAIEEPVEVAPETPDVPPVVAPAVEEPVAVAPVTGSVATTPAGPAPFVPTSTAVTQLGPQTPPLSFYMHDILGGTHPSARVVTGIIATSGDNNIPFSKANNNVFPLQGGVPLLNGNINNLINNNNNLPFLAGFNGAQGGNAILQNNGNSNILNGGNNQPFVTAGQLPSGTTLQQLMFGSLTVIDDELTEGEELGSSVIGKAQGFYLASSLDGTSQTIALTLLLHGGEHDHGVDDTISLFGVHRTASLESQIAVIGGTGKYENAKGYATVETLHHQEDQHTTDGVDTMVHFSVYLSEH